MLDDEFVIDVIYGDGSEPLHCALPEQKRGALAVYHRSLDILQYVVSKSESNSVLSVILVDAKLNQWIVPLSL